MSTSIATTSSLGAWATIRRGLQISPRLRQGLALTLVIALVSTAGRVVIPVVVQRSIDDGILAVGGSRTEVVLRYGLVALLGLAVTAYSQFLVNVRLFEASEGGLMQLRVAAFRHIHDLSVLTQNTERRGALVSRVTSDVDTISMFVQFGGLMLIIAVGQLTLATALMVAYSPPLAAVVWACYAPLILVIRVLQGIVGRAYTVVRQRVGEMLGAISEAVVGAATIRAYGVADRTAQRIDAAVEAHRAAAMRAQVRAITSFTLGQGVSGLTTAAVLVVGTVLAVDGRLTVGELLAFLFLVQLFTMPVQQGTEILNEMQNAVAGWRRVIGVIDTPADIADPGEAGVTLPRGPITVEVDDVEFAYPGGQPVLREVSLAFAPRTRVAIVGETGSGKSTLAKLLTRLADPTRGVIRLDGADLRDISFASLRSRVVLVPQEGFLFDASLLENLTFGMPDASPGRVGAVLRELGLGDWLDGLPAGLDTPVGQRGESLSAGERQLVALARAYLADPDLLILDEATSAVDPHTEVTVQRAIDALTRGRTSITIAHRLSTAEAADEIVVVERGRITQRGPHARLVQEGGAYGRLYASWVAQQRG